MQIYDNRKNLWSILPQIQNSEVSVSSMTQDMAQDYCRNIHVLWKVIKPDSGGYDWKKNFLF